MLSSNRYVTKENFVYLPEIFGLYKHYYPNYSLSFCFEQLAFPSNDTSTKMLVNSAEPDQTDPQKQSGLGLHCFL